jgi:hypothetical protein
MVMNTTNQKERKMADTIPAVCFDGKKVEYITRGGSYNQGGFL